MNYEQLYFRRIIDATTHIFIRDIDLNYDQPNSSYIDENGEVIERTNEIAITAPACVGDKRRAILDNDGNFIEWGN